MFRAQIYEDNVPVVFETRHPVLFSILYDSAFEKKWKPWRNRHFSLRQDGSLVYRKTKGSSIKGKLDLHGTKIIRQALDTSVSNPLIHKEFGISVSCRKDGIETSFRCVLGEDELNRFYEAVRAHVPSHSIDTNMTTLHRTESTDESRLATQSVMRTAITHAMDRFESSNNKSAIVRRRGAMRFLPVYFRNDLVHGSWWFVIGSVSLVITSCVILANNFHTIIETDDSNMSKFHYRGAWLMMIISGVFFTLGSLAFVRAVHESPPMKPLFSWYHVSSDELLGSWLFLFACLPFIPYTLIYLSESTNKLFYIGVMAATLLLIFGCFLFVLSCYPSSTVNQRQYILPLLKILLWACCSDSWIRRNLANDWLAGTWIIFWGTLVACVGALILTAAALASSKLLLAFMFGTGFIENLMFLIGSAYFVAGSYPDSLMDEIDGLSTPIESERSTTTNSLLKKAATAHGGVSLGEDVYVRADGYDV